VNDTPNIRKKEEFDAFLKIIGAHGYAHWIDVARILNIDKDTVTEWKKLPEARIAFASGLSHALQKMEETGKNDWRMWQAKVKMLGIVPPTVDEEEEERERPIQVILDTSLAQTAGCHSS
jgi:hypothetical protein